MEEKKIIGLTDETLDEVAGGQGDGAVVVACTLCWEGKIAIPPSGPWSEFCPKCGATIICMDGKVQFCIQQKQQPEASWDTDDSWL